MIVPFFIDRTDTVVVMVSDTVRTSAAFDWLTPSLVIVGWIVLFLYQRWLQDKLLRQQTTSQHNLQRALLEDQREQFRERLMLEAAEAISADLLRYERWLLEHSKGFDGVYASGEANIEVLRELSADAEREIATEWSFTIRGKERMLPTIKPSITERLVELLKQHVAIRTRVEKVALSKEIVDRISKELIELTESVEVLRKEVLVTVNTAVFGDPWPGQIKKKGAQDGRETTN